MSFVIRVDDGRDLEVGATLPTLVAIGRLASYIEEDELGEFQEFLGLVDTNGEDVSAGYVSKLAEQAEKLKERAGGDEVWLLDRLIELTGDQT